MTARISIGRESIVAAALELVREGGWEAVSARSIAGRLGSSTMPIYSGMGSMEELRRLTRLGANRLLHDEQQKPRTGNPTLDLAVGYVAFARGEPRLFRFALEGRGKGIGSEGDAEIVARDDVRSLLDTIADSANQGDFLLRSWVFTHGLAELLALGVIAMDDDEIARHLMAAGGAFYLMEKDGGNRK